MVQELVRDCLGAIKLERKSLEAELKVLRGGVEKAMSKLIDSFSASHEA